MLLSWASARAPRRLGAASTRGSVSHAPAADAGCWLGSELGRPVRTLTGGLALGPGLPHHMGAVCKGENQIESVSYL